MADEHFFPGGDFSSVPGTAPFFGSSSYAPGLDAAACATAMAPAAAYGIMPWADLLMREDSSAATATAHFDSALSSLVSSPAHADGGRGDDVAIGDLIGRLGSICNAASANNSCYSTPLSSPPRGASPAALAFRGCYPGAGLETGRLSRVASSKSLGATHPAALEDAEVDTGPKMACNTGTPPGTPAKGAARKRKAPAKGKAAVSSSAMTAATNANPKRSKVADSGNDEDAAVAEEENAMAPAPEPPRDYIHVRARRGQATDSHSLAERVRRERIGERMKLLQSLVPGCTKITGKALMLDEIINYVQSLQRQVEFLSMKLSTMNPELDLDAQAMHETATSMLAPYHTDPHAAFLYADPFTGAHPSSMESCSSFFQPGTGHGFGWEAHDLQSIVHHNMEPPSHGHGQQLQSPSSPPQPHHGSGQQQQQQAASTVNRHMKVEP